MLWPVACGFPTKPAVTEDVSWKSNSRQRPVQPARQTQRKVEYAQLDARSFTFKPKSLAKAAALTLAANLLVGFAK